MSTTQRGNKHRDAFAGVRPAGVPRASYGPSSADRER